MTRLYELYKTDPAAAIEEIQCMDIFRLFVELDDTLRIDVLHKTQQEWANMPDMQLYREILAQICFWVTAGSTSMLPEVEIDPYTGAELHPGDPDNCQGNGEDPEYEICCCDCNYFLECFPEYDKKQ